MLRFVPPLSVHYNYGGVLFNEVKRENSGIKPAIKMHKSMGGDKS